MNPELRNLILSLDHDLALFKSKNTRFDIMEAYLTEAYKLGLTRNQWWQEQDEKMRGKDE